MADAYPSIYLTTSSRGAKASGSAAWWVKPGNRKFQFRLSAYNVFNHPQRTPDDSVNFDLNFTNGAQTNKNFGLLPKDNKYGHWILQMAFKFYF